MNRYIHNPQGTCLTKICVSDSFLSVAPPVYASAGIATTTRQSPGRTHHATQMLRSCTRFPPDAAPPIHTSSARRAPAMMTHGREVVGLNCTPPHLNIPPISLRLALGSLRPPHPLHIEAFAARMRSRARTRPLPACSLKRRPFQIGNEPGCLALEETGGPWNNILSSFHPPLPPLPLPLHAPCSPAAHRRTRSAVASPRRCIARRCSQMTPGTSLP